MDGWERHVIQFESLSEHVVLNGTAKCRNPAFPVDLLTFGIGAPRVADGDFINASTFHSGNSCGDFMFKSESVLLQCELLEDLTVIVD